MGKRETGSVHLFGAVCIGCANDSLNGGFVGKCLIGSEWLVWDPCEESSTHWTFWM